MNDTLNSAQHAPAWQPDNLAGIKVGDYVRLPAIAVPLQVIAINDPLLTLQAPSGHQLRAGWRAVTRIRTRDQIEAGR